MWLYLCLCFAVRRVLGLRSTAIQLSECSHAVRKRWTQYPLFGHRRWTATHRIQPLRRLSFSRPPLQWTNPTEMELFRHWETTVLASPSPTSLQCLAPVFIRLHILPSRAMWFHNNRIPMLCLSAGLVVAYLCLLSPSPYHATQFVICRRHNH